jgi:hypothetical protein
MYLVYAAHGHQAVRALCSTQVENMDAPHTCEWSRKTIDTVECKVCERTMSMEEYLKHAAS